MPSPEFDKYDLHGDYHWKVYHAKSDSTYRRHVRRVVRWVREHRILDVGAGDGLITAKMRSMGKDCEGIDNNRTAVMLAQKRKQPVCLGSVYAVKGKYDAVFLGDVIEHLGQPGEALVHLLSVAPILYVATPPRGMHDDTEYHVREWMQDELREFVESFGWRETESEISNGRILARFKQAKGKE